MVGRKPSALSRVLTVFFALLGLSVGGSESCGGSEGEVSELFWVPGQVTRLLQELPLFPCPHRLTAWR